MFCTSRKTRLLQDIHFTPETKTAADDDDEEEDEDDKTS